ncbi:MAG TPA: thiol:disulfide interchange protein DsbA/DsbL [Steroidobacter sp.]|jgi:thiol:disulfide interchange protein DsbA|nr:thiol:disulfide interchange protein DsbA/DsbL [Steroidobacter sp.]
MKRLWLWLVPFAVLAGCGRQGTAPSDPNHAAAPATAPAQQAADPTTAPQAEAPAPPTAAPAEAVSETDEPVDAAEGSGVQPSLKLGASPATAPTSAQFREGANYQKIVPAQPTSAPPGRVEVAEVFWYGCGHCYALDPAIESWRSKGKAAYVDFVRVPAMWNETTRMHARVFFTAEALGKLDALHSLIFREIHVNGDPLNSVDKIKAFFQQHGVGGEEFTKAFSSFSVENKLQRADFLNRRYRISSVPAFIVNGKYKTGADDAGGESQLFMLIDELAAHEHGGAQRSPDAAG